MIFKRCNVLKFLLMHPKDKIFPHLCQDIVNQWTCPAEACNSSYIGESSRCLENRIKEHNTSTTCTIYQHNSIHNHPKADILNFKIINQYREAIHMWRTNPALNHNKDKMYIRYIFNLLLGNINNPSVGHLHKPKYPPKSSHNHQHQVY